MKKRRRRKRRTGERPLRAPPIPAAGAGAAATLPEELQLANEFDRNGGRSEEEDMALRICGGPTDSVPRREGKRGRGGSGR